MIQKIVVKEFENSAGTLQDIRFSYEFFGKPPGEAPIVLVNHALTGNSTVTGNTGWWEELIGEGKCIDTNFFTILAFNMPGNGYEEQDANLLHNYKEFTLGDIAGIYARALDQLGITSLYAGIGGSIGGALLWEIAALRPGLFKKIIPVATDYKASQWLRALCKVQDQILHNSAEPLKDARMHAMTFYRSPQSLEAKFGNSVTGSSSVWDVEFWLEHHGRKLEERFKLASYKLMNHLLTTIDISKGSGDQLSAAARIEGEIHIVTVNSDRFFLPEDNWNTYVNLSLVKNNTYIHEIKSIHGHDAFLIENSQLKSILEPVFNTTNLEKQKIKESISS
ncbi:MULTISPECIES: alpha/beta fold hydrolase [Antarcticibacterium]|uniref:alpha/beta fold hydrolase n=1 Tax=Antarcticibacterium TaxID=2058174 RepID=UPI001FE30673|nr:MULTISPECIES: alpha/beta fold hydrolase [Antarcticibacterium]